jgi:DNA-binding NarL/FixJ family response regulator
MRPRVLLADDYQGLLEAWQRLLAPSCDVIGSVSNGRAVLEAAARLDPDVIVLDVAMPEINGLEVCRRITASMPRVGVVLVTAIDSPEVRHAALSVGAAAFVVKHTAADELEPAVRHAWAKNAPEPDR